MAKRKIMAVKNVGMFRKLEVKKRRNASCGSPMSLEDSSRIAYKDAWRAKRERDVRDYVASKAIYLLGDMIIEKNSNLPSKTHVKLAEAHLKRIVRIINKASRK